MIGIPNGIAKAGMDYGLEIKVNQKVEKLLMENGTAFGVKLENGSEITAKLVVSNLNAQVTYLKLVGPHNLPGWAVKAIASYSNSMPCPMIYVGLDKKPDLEAHHTIVTSSLESMNDVWNNYYKMGSSPRPP